jgi:hypothetical protein
VTDRDAFGNPITPGSGTTTPPRPAPTPAYEALPGDDAPAAPALSPASPLGVVLPTIPTYGPSKPSWGARLVGFSVFLIFALPLGLGGWFAYHAFQTAKDTTSTVHRLTRDLSPTTPSTGTPAPSAAADPVGVSGASLLKATNLTKALAAARRDPGGRLTLLRVAPARANLQLAPRGGGLNLLELRADGGRSLVRTPGTPNKAIPYATIDERAPARLVRAAAKRLHRSPKAIDYVVLIDVLDGPRWSAYFTGGGSFQGDAHGHITQRIQ